MSFDNSFRSRIEKKLKEMRETSAADFIESRDDNIHEIGESRGYLRALSDVLNLCVEIEQEINDEHSPTGKSSTDKA